MPVSVTWTLPAATYCPPLGARAANLNPDDATPPVAQALAAGDTSALLTKFNELAERADMAASNGGGAWCIVQRAPIPSFDLEDPGDLNINVTAGEAVLDGVVAASVTQQVPLADNSYNWVYLQADGTPVVLSDPDPLNVPPVTIAARAYLGRVTTEGGIITAIDYSGRLELRGGTLYRRTADAGIPTDTPPQSIQIETRTAGGDYWWDGNRYVRVHEPFPIVSSTLQAGESAYIPAGYQSRVMAPYTVAGSLTIAGQFRID